MGSDTGKHLHDGTTPAHRADRAYQVTAGHHQFQIPRKESLIPVKSSPCTLESQLNKKPEDDIYLVRVFSQAQIFAQYATGELGLIDDECHLEALRVRRAETDPEFTPFLEAVGQLRVFGKLRDETVHTAYIAKISEHH